MPKKNAKTLRSEVPGNYLVRLSKLLGSLRVGTGKGELNSEIHSNLINPNQVIHADFFLKLS
jgi:hypothetical protein